MSNDNNIKTFTAADIEKYHKGQLTPLEMHAMEKAALDDPFLADALEGYSVSGVDAQADIADLNRRLAEKTEPAKVIPLYGTTKSFPWLRVAVLVLFIAGAGLMSYFFLFKNDTPQTPVAITAEKQNRDTSAVPHKTELAGTDSNDHRTDKEAPAGVVTNAAPDNRQTETNESATAKTKPGTDGDGQVERFDIDDKAPAKADESKDLAAGNLPATVKPDVPKRDNPDLSSGDVDKRSIEPDKEQKRKAAVEAATAQNLEQTARLKESVAKRREDHAVNLRSFRGKITDAQNNPLPFANVTNTTDNVGTYTDAQGNFTLLSADSVMEVEVRSLGFVNNKARLLSDLPTNQVMMKEDEKITDIVLSTAKRNYTDKVKDGNLVLEEPEPAEGWANYDTYLSNNLNVPENFDVKTRKTQNDFVELSFEVNKDGDPIKIRVEKSLCHKCDEEAKRLVQQGPKWKRKSKKGKRTTVKVPFSKPVD